MIPEQAQQRLREAAKTISNSQWAIGSLTNELLEELTPQYHDFQIHAAVGEICDLSAGRIRKLAQVEAAFPERDETLMFGYYERALDLDEGDRPAAIEFVSFFEEEYGRRLRVGEFTFMFRQHILGEESPPPIVLDGQALEHATLVYQNLLLLADLLSPGHALERPSLHLAHLIAEELRRQGHELTARPARVPRGPLA